MAKLLKIKALFKLPVISWALYDFANTSFAVVIMTIIFPVYFTNVIVSGAGYGLNFGDLMWGVCSGVTMLLAALIAPIFGAVADTSRSKNKFLIILTCISVFFCFLLYFLGSGMIIAAMILFIAANFFYQTSMMFYNSFLPELSNRDNTGTVSGFGFAMGYLGGLITLLIIFPLLGGGLEAPNLTGIRMIFVMTAVFFLVFSIPSFLFLKDKPTKKVIDIKTSYIRYGFSRLAKTLRNIRHNRNLLKFLLAYFLFSNAFSVLAVYASIYARNTLNLTLPQITLLFIIGNIPTIISSFFFGWLIDRIGAKNVIITTLIIWIIIILLIAIIDLRVLFYMAYVLIAIATGSTLIASRSLMTFLIPVGREAEYFSFYSIGGKFSAILGPVTFGLVSYFTKSQRLALLSTLFFLISGLIIIQFVKVPKRRPGSLHY